MAERNSDCVMCVLANPYQAVASTISEVSAPMLTVRNTILICDLQLNMPLLRLIGDTWPYTVLTLHSLGSRCIFNRGRRKAILVA